MTRKGHGIELTGRNEEQPADRERALDPSSARQDAEQHFLRDHQANRDQPDAVGDVPGRNDEPAGRTAESDATRPIRHKQGGRDRQDR